MSYRLRDELDAARAAVGEAWFAGGVTLAEAITHKCAVLELEAGYCGKRDLSRCNLECEEKR